VGAQKGHLSVDVHVDMYV